jgi:hypothetical protein
MKIHYREATVLDEMNNAIFVQAKSKPIEYFELTQEEFNASYTMFDKSHQSDSVIQYSYKGVLIRVTQ